MKTFRTIALGVVMAFVDAFSHASNQEKIQQALSPCPTPSPTPIVYSTLQAKPKILHKDTALYTVKARDEKIQGTIVLSVVFHESGKITDIRVIKGLPYGLTEQAIGTAYMIEFTPAIKDGRSVSVKGNLVYSFKLY